MKKKRAIIFDLDGTLLNTIEDIANLTNFALNKHGFPEKDISSYREMVGHGLLNLVTRALPPGIEARIVQSVYNTLINVYLENPVKKTFIYQGIIELLTSLSSMNIPIAILSNKMHEITIRIVSILFADFEFFSVIGSRENYPKKPDPRSALEICEKISINPSLVLMVGDSATDIKTAIASGMTPIGVSWGYRSVTEISEAGAKFIINKPSELLKFVDESVHKVCSNSNI